MRSRLTQKQEVFCLKYFELGNASEAARIAKYSPKTSGVMGAENLLKPKIQARIDELRKKAEDATVATVLERRQVLTEIIRGRQTDFMTCSADGVWMHDIGEETLNKAALKKIRTTTMPFGDKDSELKIILTEVELVDPIRAIDILSKLDGDFAPEKHQHLGVILTGDLTDEQLAAIINKGDIPSRRSIGTSKQTPGP